MSLYCKGEKCNRSRDCLRVRAWEKYPYKDTPTGMATGLWLVEESECMSNKHNEGVFAESATLVELLRLFTN